jgi:hypothetical protein
MSDLSSFKISFYVYDNSGTPQSLLLSAQPQPPSGSSSDNINKAIEDLKSFLSTSGINLKNLPLVKSEVQSISGTINNSLSYSSDSKELASQLESNISSSTSLQQILTQLQTSISTTSTIDSEVVTPETDTASAPPAYISSIQTKKYNTPQTNVTSTSTIGSKVKGLSDTNTTLNTNMTTMLNKVKGAFNNLLTSKGNKTTHSSTTNADTVLSGILGEQSSLGKSGTVQNNVFNNIVKSFVGDGTTRQRGGGRKPISRKPTITANETTTTNTSTKPNAELNAYQIPKATIDDANPTITTTSDYYQVTATESNGKLMVTYGYFTGSASQSTKSFTFYLNPVSLIYLSTNAYNKVSKAKSQMRTNICKSVGYTPVSGTATNQELWCCYLIWMLSYLSFGVSSQLYTSSSYVSFPTSIDGNNAFNYMLEYEYMEQVGNFGMTCQMYNMNSEQKSFVKVGIPGNWPYLMYSSLKKSRLYHEYTAGAINTMLSQQLSTTSST